MISKYRLNVYKTLHNMILGLGQLPKVLDFGAGDGEFAYNISKISSIKELKAIDVIQRKHLYFPALVSGYKSNNSNWLQFPSI